MRETTVSFKGGNGNAEQNRTEQNRTEQNRRCPLRNMSARVLALLLAVFVLAGCGGGGTGAAGSSTQENGAAAGAAGRMEGEGFATAEEAAKAYVDGLIANDIDAMLAACAIESYVDHFDLEKYIERCGAYPNIHMNNVMLPDAGETARRINIEYHRSELISEIRYQYLWLVQRKLIDKQYGQPQTNLSDYDSVAQLMEENFNTNEDVMKDIRLVSVEELSSLLKAAGLTDEQIRDTEGTMERRAGVLGADEVTGRALLLDIAGTEYYFVPDLVRYGDRWYVSTTSGLSASMLKINVLAGGLIPADELK